MKKLIAAATIALGATAIVAPVADARPTAPNSIVDVAVAANGPDGAFPGVFDTLITAVGCADEAVVKTLTQRGQYTVFAPTDDAFLATLGVDETSVCTIDKGALTEVLLYHVAKGRRDAAAVTSSDRIRMLNREFTAIDGATIDGANIIVTDVPASNGIIHAIDAVLLPDLITG